MSRFLCLCLACLVSLPLAAAEVYKVRDKNGNITYTDSPPKDRPHEKVELRPINSQPAVEPERNFRPTNENTADEEAAPVNYAMRLAAPADESHVPPGQRNLEMSVAIEPGLHESHRVQFLMNAQPVGEPGRHTSLVIREIYRGAHQLGAVILGPEGQVLAEAPTVTVYVHRPTVNSPNR